MNSHTCGAALEAITTDLPFKVSAARIVIVKALPVHQCPACGEYLLEDAVMERVESLLEAAKPGAELEILPFAA